MPDVDIISFEAALERSTKGKQHLLLGNGFSIALKPDIFTYEALYTSADFQTVPRADAIFEALGTRDFEAVIRLLVDMSRVLSAYDDVPVSLISQIGHDAAQIKTILVDAIASRHPDRPYDIANEQYASCRAFLARFMAGKIFTLNYDVLLYWTLMQNEVDLLEIKCDDGFRSPDSDPDAAYVTWQESHSPTVYYLHGALHLFDAGHMLQKYTWSRTDLPIVDQIRAALDENRYPLFVSEGHSNAKLAKIMHSGYLHKALRSLESITGNLFIFGYSLAENDNHILNLIEQGRLARLFVSIYGDPVIPANQSIIQRAHAMVERRRQMFGSKWPLAVEFFDASSAHVWG